MASYAEWNNALVEYFVSGVPKGVSVFLSVDDAAIIDIGNRFAEWGLHVEDCVTDFLQAIRCQCVFGGRVYLDAIADSDESEVPRCVGFLSTMILAAHHMAAEEDNVDIISDINYFKRLREVLGLSREDGGRPPGLTPPGVEIPLWDSWNLWLAHNGWLPSAERGSSVVDKFIHYPLSQALLREGDKEKLERLFRGQERAHRLSRRWDRDQLGAWLRSTPSLLPSSYLRQLIQEPDPRRFEAINDALHEVYSTLDWDENTLTSSTHGNPLSQRRLTAGIYRDANANTGTINYLLYPRQPKRSQGEQLQLWKDGKALTLRNERPGWFYPLWAESPRGGVHYEVRGSAQVKELVLPERRFWILVRDPESSDSGDFGSWGLPEVGETFLLLCRKECAEQMSIFRDEALINWDHEFGFSHSGEEWVEYRECMVLTQNWEGVLPQDAELYEALKSNAFASISLAGGLRAPRQGAWLEGYGPEVKVNAFEYPVMLDLFDIHDPEEPIKEIAVASGVIMDDFKQLESGTYILKAYERGGTKVISQRSLRILPWEELSAAVPTQANVIKLNNFTLEGGVLKANEQQDVEEVD
jgi:hypothetical protein